MEFFQVCNWRELQHYKDRAPPWIKLYNHLLENYEFSLLADQEKFHLLGIYLLASRQNNKLPMDPGWIKKKIDADSEVNLHKLIELGFIELILDSDAIAESKHAASKALELCSTFRTQRRGEEREKRREDSASGSKCLQMLNDPEVKR
ncbi:MAG: hypothetical protein CML06_21055 [Pseudomonadales bacterium]|nr:hypothetical protein [Pseudomonadales bacterium]